jgi:hypothetical protein
MATRFASFNTVINSIKKTTSLSLRNAPFFEEEIMKKEKNLNVSKCDSDTSDKPRI